MKKFSKLQKISNQNLYKIIKTRWHKSFSLSDKAINSLVNNGSLRADDAIIFINGVKMQIGKCANLENIILDDME